MIPDRLPAYLTPVEPAKIEASEKTLIFETDGEKFQQEIVKTFPGIEEIWNDPLIVDDRFIRDWMSADEMFRGIDGKGVGWPLLTDFDLYATMIYFRYSRFTTNMPFVTVNNGYGSSFYNEDHKCREDPLALQNWHQALKSHQIFSLVQEVLRMGRGHLIAAGGAISHLLMGHSFDARGHPKDVDFFFIGFNPNQQEEASELLQDILRQLDLRGDVSSKPHEGWHPLRDDTSDSSDEEQEYDVATVLCSPKCLTLYTHHDRFQLQFIFRLYPDTGDLLTNISLPIGGFDLHSCAVAMSVDELGTVHFHGTPAAAFALGTGTNVLMTSRNSTSMIPRLGKYLHRGFDILFPGTSREKMASKSRGNQIIHQTGGTRLNIFLPHLTIHSCDGEVRPRDGPATETSDYETGTLGGNLGRSNILALIDGKPERYNFEVTTTGFLKDLRKARPPSDENLSNAIFLLLDDLIQYYKVRDNAQFGMECWKPVFRKTRRVLKGVIQDRLDADSQAFPEQLKYHQTLEEIKGFRAVLDSSTAESLPESVRIHLTEKLREHEKNLKLTFNETVNAILTDIVASSANVYAQKVRQFHSELLEKARDTRDLILEQTMPVWNVTNPLTQHTASNNPTITNAREWWGSENYIPFRVGFPDEVYFILKCACRQYLGCYGDNTLKKVILPVVVRVWAESMVTRIVEEARSRAPRHLQHLICRSMYSASRSHIGPPNFDPTRLTEKVQEFLPSNIPDEVRKQLVIPKFEISATVPSTPLYVGGPMRMSMVQPQVNIQDVQARQRNTIQRLLDRIHARNPHFHDAPPEEDESSNESNEDSNDDERTY